MSDNQPNRMRYFAWVATGLLFMAAFALPGELFAQADQGDGTLEVGDSITVSLKTRFNNGTQGTQLGYALQGVQEGQFITFRLDNPTPDVPVRAAFEPLTADSLPAEFVTDFYNNGSFYHVVQLKHAPPYHLIMTVWGGKADGSTEATVSLLDGDQSLLLEPETIAVGEKLEIKNHREFRNPSYRLNGQPNQMIKVTLDYIVQEDVNTEIPEVYIYDADGKSIERLTSDNSAVGENHQASFGFNLKGPAPYRLQIGRDSGLPLLMGVFPDMVISVSERNAEANVSAANSIATIHYGDEIEITPALGQTKIYTLDIALGDLLTVYSAELGDPDHSVFARLRDADGLVFFNLFESPNLASYRVTGQPPYILEVKTGNPFTFRIEKGDLPRQDEGAVTLGSNAGGQVDQEHYNVHRIEAEEGDTITVRYSYDYDHLIRVDLRNQNTTVHPVAWLTTVPDRNSDDGLRQEVLVYRLTGASPYELLVSSVTSTGYQVKVESGETIERKQLGTLTAGSVVRGVMPPVSPNVYYYYVVDAQPDQTITLTEWNKVFSPGLVGGMGALYYANDAYDDGFTVFDLDQDLRFQPPYLLPVASDNYNVGKAYILTMAEGDQPLKPEEAVADTDTQAMGDSGAAATAGIAACSVTSSNAVNERSGPGTTYAVAGKLSGSADADGQATGADGNIWWRLSAGGWVRSDLVSEDSSCDSLPVVKP